VQDGHQDSAYQRAAGAARREEGGISGWTVGFSVFAGTMMIISGIFQVFQGLAAILEDDFFVLGRAYAYDIDVTTWGWIHLVAGLIIAAAGAALFSGALWARVIAIFLALVSMVINFAYIPYYPVWSLLIIAIDIGVIWAITSLGRDTSETAS
jgi:hypothetical protein